MAFKTAGTLSTNAAPVLRKAIITNSVVSTILDSIKITSGFAALGTAGALVFGHMTNHKRKDDVGVETSGATGAATGSYVGTFTAASNNQTVGMVKAETDVSKFTLYSAELSGVVGTTTGSNLLDYNFDLSDANTLDETSATAATAQYHSWGIDPNLTSQVIVNIKESSVFGV